jgi:hypothetical protein
MSVRRPASLGVSDEVTAVTSTIEYAVTIRKQNVVRQSADANERGVSLYRFHQEAARPRNTQRQVSKAARSQEMHAKGRTDSG